MVCQSLLLLSHCISDLTDFRPGRDASSFKLHGSLMRYNSHVHHHNLTNRLCLRVYDIRRGEPEGCKALSVQLALHIVHTSPNGAYRRCIFIAGLVCISGINFPVLSAMWHRES
jgi:hypothetical protein